ncbi:MAG: hypothetical protein LBC19_01745 [Tannerella sp.]|jgi:pilus assembly protein CpaB|nr:hypothetical protein [Tannerella sp.]
MNILKNRVILGSVCIVISLVICFVIAPHFNSAMEKMTDAARLKNDITAGKQIEDSDIEIVKTGAHNMDGTVSEKSDIIGKFALYDVVKNEIVMNIKIGETPASDSNCLYSLDGEKQAISITINGFANGLSGKLQAGDIVSIYAPDTGSHGDFEIQPPELKYMKVIAFTNQNGYDVSNDFGENKTTADAGGNEKKLLPSAVTVLANERQSAILAQLEADTRVHISLVYRGNDDTAKKFLDEQEKVFAETDETAEPDESDKTAVTSETFESAAANEKVVSSEPSTTSPVADYEDFPDLEDITEIPE